MHFLILFFVGGVTYFIPGTTISSQTQTTASQNITGTTIAESCKKEKHNFSFSFF